MPQTNNFKFFIFFLYYTYVILMIVETTIEECLKKSKNGMSAQAIHEKLSEYSLQGIYFGLNSLIKGEKVEFYVTKESKKHGTRIYKIKK